MLTNITINRSYSIGSTLQLRSIPMWDTTHKSPTTSVDASLPKWLASAAPCCPTSGTAAYNSHPSCWLHDLCGNTGSESPWWPWVDGGHHGRRVHGFASFS